MINDYNILCYRIGGKYSGPKLGWTLGILAIIGTVFNNVSLINSILMESAEHLEPLFGTGMLPLKLCIVLIYITLAGLVFEP